MEREERGREERKCNRNSTGSSTSGLLTAHTLPP